MALIKANRLTTRHILRVNNESWKPCEVHVISAGPDKAVHIRATRRVGKVKDVQYFDFKLRELVTVVKRNPK